MLLVRLLIYLFTICYSETLSFILFFITNYNNFTHKSIIAMSQIVNLIDRPINLTLYAWISSCTPTLIFKYWPTYILITLQTFIEFAINYKSSFHYCCDNANKTAMFFCIQGVPVPYLCACISKTQWFDALP